MSGGKARVWLFGKLEHSIGRPCEYPEKTGPEMFLKKLNFHLIPQVRIDRNCEELSQ